MGDYININGNNIPIRASDPSNPIIGEIWYNSTTNLLKGQGATTVGAWSSGGNMNTAVSEMGGSGTATAGLAVGGAGGGNTEEYNGTSWTNHPDSPITGYVAAFGTQTATITATGSPNTASAIYNGSTWTSGPSLASAQSNAAGAGILTSGIIAGGNTPPPRSSQVQSYNGTSWSSETSLPAAKGNIWGAGAGETSALMMGGGDSTGPLTPNTLEYDGSAWTAGSNMPSARESGMGGGLQTAALYAGGNAGTGPPTNTNSTILYNGTTWTTSANLATSRSAGGGATSNSGNTTGLVFAGNTGTNVTSTEEFTGAGAPVTQTISSS